MNEIKIRTYKSDFCRNQAIKSLARIGFNWFMKYGKYKLSYGLKIE